jgi:putative colanic acid biosysnthesis UDP-glucose lipid carrier transferase
VDVDLSGFSGFSKRSNSWAGIIRIFDITVILLSLVAAAQTYGVALTNLYLTGFLLVLVAYYFVAESLDLYRTWRLGKITHMIVFCLLSLIAAFGFALVVTFLLKTTEQYSRVAVMLWVLYSSLSIIGWRLALYRFKSFRRSRGYDMRSVAIICANETSANLMKQIEKHQELGYTVSAIFDDRTEERQLNDPTLKVNGSIDEGIERAVKGEFDKLYICLPITAEERSKEIILKLGETSVDVYVIPDTFLHSLVHARIDHVGDIDAISVFESPYYGAKIWFKRLFDIFVSLGILSIIAIPMVFIAFAVKFTSKGPIIFKQKRHGEIGQEILVWKFRSMSTQDNGAVVKQATRNDARITKVGAFIRRTSLDELPQFINVLKGDMSIVGPRPHAIAHNLEFKSKVDFYMMRHKVKPGITGWAQINGWRGETDTLEKMEKRVEFDLYYIKHWSLWMDVKIVFLTIFKGFIDKNAY